MTLLPSPIPHPLEFSPWELPGWVYEALNWVVGVEWPEGDERAVWDLADQWYGVAAALAGPRADAVAAVTEVRAGYGGTGAVAQAFDAAWRRVADGDEAPLPVLLAISQDLGRLVEECGCDIEGAKIEVWIELAILVTELAILATVTVLTAGAASPAAAPVIAATRVIVQQIFRRLVAQLARKTLKHGLKEAGERAAKETVQGAARSLTRKALIGGAVEAAEESGITLATQAYQNTTGRRQGLDAADLGASAVGGLAGGAAAPLAFLGKNATGRVARIGEHVGRSMTGEVIAENAASLATGQGPTSLEDAARAAVSGARGSATAQSDAALQARLDGRLSALAGASYAPVQPGTPPPVPPEVAGSGRVPESSAPPYPPTWSGEVPAQRDGSAAASGPPVSETGSQSPAAVARPEMPQALAEVHQPGDRGAAPAEGAAPVALTPETSETWDSAAQASTVSAPERAPTPTAPALAAVEATAVPPVADPVVRPPVDPAPTVALTAVEPTTVLPPSADGPGSPGGIQSQTDPLRPAPLGTDPTAAGPRQGETAPPSVDPTLSAVVTEPSAAPATFTPATGPVDAGTGTTAGPTSNPTPTPGPTSGATSPVSSTITAPTTTGPASGGADVGRSAGAGAQRPEPPSPATYRSVMQALNPGMPLTPPTDPPRQPQPGDWEHLRPRTPEWYAAKWAAEREGLDRRRYQGYFEAQRAWFEENRRRDLATELREKAEQHYDEARWLARRAFTLSADGDRANADRHVREARLRERMCHQQRDLADSVLAGAVVPEVVSIDDEADFRRINDDVADLAPGAVETGDRSALTGDGHPPTIDRSRRYGVRGGLRPPLALHQTDLERQMPRDVEGQVVRTADPRQGGWFRLANDGGPRADPTRGINCIDCTLSFFETWVHGRPRVAAPRTFDAYAEGDIRAPLGGEEGGTGRIEDVTGGRFQRLCTPPDAGPAAVAYTVDLSYRNLHDQLRLGGHGSLAFVVHEWEGGGSHIWVAVNQNGTILYLDPQTNLVADRPLYGHAGFAHAQNVTGLDVLVLGPDGRPMPMGGLQRGRYSDRPDLPEYPPAPHHQGYGEPYINRLHLLDGPGSAMPPNPRPGASPVSGVPDPQPTDGRTDPVESSLREVVAAATDLDALRAPTVDPAHLAAELDAPTLRRLVTHLDEQGAQNAARLFADARVRQMLADVAESPPKEHPQLAATLVAQLARQPDLVRIILGTPELAVSLTARPVTLHNLAKHQQAIDALTEVLDDIETGRYQDLPAVDGEQSLSSPLTESQRAISVSIGSDKSVSQPGFDVGRRNDSGYVAEYLDGLYAAAVGAQRDLNKLASELAELDGVRVGVPGWRVEPKLRTRAEDKVAGHRGDASRLRDLAAAKVEFRSLDHLYQALRRLRDHPQVEIVTFEDRFRLPQKSGYRDLQLVLRTSNGHLGEFRLHLAQIDEITVWEHVLFEVWRDLGVLAQREGRQLTRKEQLIADGILRYQRKCFEDALRDACGGGLE